MILLQYIFWIMYMCHLLKIDIIKGGFFIVLQKLNENKYKCFERRYLNIYYPSQSFLTQCSGSVMLIEGS